MRRIAPVVAALAFAASARAATLAVSLVSFGGQQPLAATNLNADLSGSLVVSFHGDPASGCAGRGSCGYSGTIVWRPGADVNQGALTISTYRSNGRLAYTANLDLGGQPGSGADLSATVLRDIPGQAPGTCADGSSSFRNWDLPVRRGQIAVRILGSAVSTPLLSTRCAGPLDADVAASMPVASLSVKAALRGHLDVNLSTSRSFSAAGFAGTVRSTLVLHLGQATREQISTPGGVPRQRLVTESLTLVRATGGFTASVLGSTNPDICTVLDSCGMRGQLSLQPRPGVSQGELFASGSARLPYRDFLAALGLSNRSRSAGIFAGGSLAWKAGGAFAAELAQSATCRDSAPLGSGYVSFTVGRRTAIAGYNGGMLDSRCPGPRLGGPGQTLPSGSIPVRDLAHRRFSITLRPTGAFADDGYTGRLSGSLKLTFARGRASQAVVGG